MLCVTLPLLGWALPALLRAADAAAAAAASRAAKGKARCALDGSIRANAPGCYPARLCMCIRMNSPLTPSFPGPVSLGNKKRRVGEPVHTSWGTWALLLLAGARGGQLAARSEQGGLWIGSDGGRRRR